MKKFNKTLKGLVFISFILLMTTCATEEIGKQNVTQSSTEAKIWLDANKKNYNTKLFEYVKDIHWQDAIVSNGESGEVIEVPFTLSTNLSASSKEANLYNDHHRLMFIKNPNAGFKVFNVTIFTTDLKYNIADKDFNYYSIKDDFDGKILVQELETNTGSKINFHQGKQIRRSMTARYDEEVCVYYGYWYEDGHFEALYEVACYGGGSKPPTTPGSGTPGPGYGSGGSGGGHENPSTSCPAGYKYVLDDCVPIETPPSCESFNFTSKPGTIWQESAVVNVHFNIVLIDLQGYSVVQAVEFPQAILFGTPTNTYIGDTQISAGIAATLSAQALKTSMDDVVKMYGNNPVSELTVRLYFEERLKYNYPLFIPGGRVNFNASSFTGVPTVYKTNFLSTGNCN